MLTEAIRYSEDTWYAENLRRMETIPAAVRQKSDERWRDVIRSIVLAGQEAGEFASVDADDFTITLSALLDGFAVQIALEDPAVPPRRTYELAMRFAAGQLGFDWKPVPAPGRARKRGR